VRRQGVRDSESKVFCFFFSKKKNSYFLERANMKRLALALTITAFTAGTAHAADDAALAAPLKKLVDAINHADQVPPAGVFTNDAVVLDDFAPYRWSGKGNATNWYKDLVGTDAKSHADFLALKGILSVDSPKFSRITGDTAYFVVPGIFVFNTDPKTRIKQTSQWIISERLVHGHWLIAGHAWAIESETPVGK